MLPVNEVIKGFCSVAVVLGALSPELGTVVMTPTRPLGSVSVDFITCMPKTARGHEHVAVWVDRLTKMVRFVAMPAEATVEDVATVFIENIFKHHGLPTSIVSDRDPKFTAAFWKSLMNRFGVRLAMSTAAHPQTDGQTERINRVIEEMPRHFINPEMTDWDVHLPMCEFAYNSAVREATQALPFS